MAGRFRAVALAVLVVLSSGVLAASVTASGPGHAHDTQVDDPPAPDDDAIGWECGYWHNDTVDVDQSDGLDDEELDALVCRTMARVEQIRGLEFEDSVPVSVQSRDEFRADVRNRSVDRDLRTFDNVKFESLFLVNQSTDSIAVQDSNRGTSVLGYYSPPNDRIVVVAPNGSAVRVDEYTLAHELVHALQDQQFDLSGLRAETRDEANAWDGLVEGEARYVEHRYREARCLDPSHEWNGTCMRPPTDVVGDDDLANYGVYSLEYQPYSDGPSFVSHLRSGGGWAAVDAAYDEPPESAEQVIHPERYPNESPANVTLTDRTAQDWERVRPSGRPDYGEIGQTGIASMIVYPTYHSGGATQIVPARTWLNYTETGEISPFDPLNYGFGSPDGWAGDRLHVYRNDENETAYVWRIVWDSPDDAEEFLYDYHEVLTYWGGELERPETYRFAESDFGDAIRVVHENETTTIVSAPTIDDLPAVRNGSLPPANATVDANWARPDDGSGADRSDLPAPTQPGFGPILTLIAVVLVAAAIARRRD